MIKESIQTKRDRFKVSIKANTIANYIGNGFTTTAGIVITPFYVQYLGAESYGLVGFFTLMQTWLNLLDMGLSTTLGRQVAYARGTQNGFDGFQHLLKSYELIFLTLAISIVLSIFLVSDWIALHWFQSKELPANIIAYCVSQMGAMVGLRFFSTIYKSGINGLEDQIWLNQTNIAIISFKYVGALLMLMFISTDIGHFFEYQLAVGGFEVGLLAWRFRKKIPKYQQPISWYKIDWSVFKSIIPFSLSIAYTSGIWTFLTQFDKLLLSGSLPLEKFGHFSLITLVTGGIITLSIPVFQAFMPRIIMLVSAEKKDEMLAMYAKMTQIITWITFSTTSVIVIFSKEIMFLLSGNINAAIWSEQILIWFALGSFLNILGSFQYYLQNSFGNLRLYVVGSTASFVIQLPLIYIITTSYGALGAGKLWCAFSLCWFLGWTSVVHHKLIPGFHLKWLTKDLLPIILAISILSILAINFMNFNIEISKIALFIKISVVGIFFLLISSLSINFLRDKLMQKIIKRTLLQNASKSKD